VGSLPVLKSREVAALLLRLGFHEVRRRDPIGSNAILMAEARASVVFGSGPRPVELFPNPTVRIFGAIR
jgi:predicted RNA binding protein YcfA (HicA-like mRNA interferase family)